MCEYLLHTWYLDFTVSDPLTRPSHPAGSNITLASRTWARCVWINCPDSMVKVPPTDPAEKKLNVVRAVVEKKSVINLVEA